MKQTERTDWRSEAETLTVFMRRSVNETYGAAEETSGDARGNIKSEDGASKGTQNAEAKSFQTTPRFV